MTMTEESQANMYYKRIEEEKEGFDIEESDEEVITLDFDKGIAIEQEGLIVGERLLNPPAQVVEVFEVTEPTPETVEVTNTEETVKTPVVEAPRSYKEDLTSVLVDTMTNRAIRSLIDAHNKLETDVYDELQNKHSKKMGSTYIEHQSAILKSIDQKKHELRKSYGFSGRVSYEHIPTWAKPYIEDYLKGFVNELCDFIGDVE